jgi:hypothetical protein
LQQVCLNVWLNACDAMPAKGRVHLSLALGAGIRSGGLEGAVWTVALRHAARAYPDSTSIDRRTWNAEADWSRVLESVAFAPGPLLLSCGRPEADFLVVTGVVVTCPHCNSSVRPCSTRVHRPAGGAIR